MTTASRSTYPRLALLLTCTLLAVSVATPGAVSASEPGDPYLVRDVDTTREPYFETCDVTCPPPVPEYGSLISQLTPFGDLVVFVANDRIHGFEPWVSDGTAEGTRLLADTCPGECVAERGFSHGPRLMAVFDGRLYFWGWNLDDGGFDPWSTDGTPDGTRALTELCPGLCGVWEPGPAVEFEGSLVFRTRQGVPFSAFIWRTDGTAAGTEVVRQCSSSFPSCGGFFEYDGRLFFDDGDLLRLGRPEGTPVVAWGGRVGDAARLGDRMILAVNESASSLWVMDGPLAEPQHVADVGPLSGAVQTSVSQLTSAGGLVYFVLAQNQSAALWRTDGTAEGTQPVVPRVEGRAVQVVAVLDGGPIVSVQPDPAQLPVVLPALWRVSPSGGAEVLTHLSVQSVAVVGDRLFFSAGEEDAFGRELWVSDGTPDGTELLADIAPGPASSAPGAGAGFAEAGGLLFFPAFHPDVDTELWALDSSTGEEPPPPPPPPPSTEWLESPEVPGFRAQVRITGGESSLLGRQEAACIPEALCVSGAVPGRSEVFVRVVGPKPNGFLWPTLVKFSTSTVEVWIEQASTQEVRYYRLEGARPGIDELPGLFDRTGFRP